MEKSNPRGMRRGGCIKERFGCSVFIILRNQKKKRAKEAASITARDQGSTAPNMSGAEKSTQKTP